MATMDPTDDEISQVIDFANLDPHQDRTLVIQALKNCSRNVEAVVMEYFDDAAAFRQKYNNKWNEGFFQGDRETADNRTGISFHLESLEHSESVPSATPPREAYTSGAPSRPPSRSNDKSPLGRMVEWQAGDIGPAPNFQGPEEDEMQRALRESAQQAGISLEHHDSTATQSTQQEPFFGPATRTDYDKADWSMVPVGTSNTWAAAANKASARKRVDGAPAVLVQGNGVHGNHALGGLLTILHEIPLARNTILDCGSPAETYGFASDWWNGREILPAETPLQNSEAAWQDIPQRAVFEEELHRLMAFLDSTERSYGTVSVLHSLLPYASFDTEKQFYEYLDLRNSEKLDPLFQTASPAQVHSDEIEDEIARFGLLEFDLRRDAYQDVTTLYEALDHLLWNDALSWDNFDDTTKMAVITSTGDVMAIKVGGDGPVESIEIPANFYPERWLASRRDEARRIQAAWVLTKRQMAAMALKGKAENQWLNDWGQLKHTRRDALEQGIAQWNVYGEYLEGAGRLETMRACQFDTDRFPDYHAAPATMNIECAVKRKKVDEVLKAAEKSMSELDEHIENYTKQMEALQAKQRFLGQLLTNPNKTGRAKPMTCKQYSLRGIATDANVVFVCQRAEIDLIDLEGEGSNGDQWWKLSYSGDTVGTVNAEKLDIQQVLTDVWKLTKTPTLIYATEAALSATPKPLSAPLDRFARADNKAFRQELNQEVMLETEQEMETTRGMMVDPISPSKRKHRDDSADSIDTNRASIGTDGVNAFEDPFADQTQGPGIAAGELPPSYSEAQGQTLDRTPEEPLTPPPALPPRPDGFFDEPHAEQNGSEPTSSSVPAAPEMQVREGASIFSSRPSHPGIGGIAEATLDMDLSKP